MLNLQYDEDGLHTGFLSLKRDGFLARLKAQPKIVSIVGSFTKDREIVEDFIRDIYARSYDAAIRVRYPVLMSVRDENGKILAATGFRLAAEEPLFLEQYLSAPIEDMIKTPREHIVEIGNLASDGGGASLFLFAALSAYLNYKGYTQAVVTSTEMLERRFRQMGLRPQRHAKATPALLSGNGENWGTYYESQPHVVSGSVEEGYKRLQRQLGAVYQDCRPRLLPRLHYKTNGDAL